MHSDIISILGTQLAYVITIRYTRVLLQLYNIAAKSASTCNN